MNILKMVLVASAVMVAGEVHAVRFDASKPIPTDYVRKAVHLATGCLALVRIDDGKLVSAKIIDPTCLPNGGLPRVIPGGPEDFVIVVPR